MSQGRLVWELAVRAIKGFYKFDNYRQDHGCTHWKYFMDHLSTYNFLLVNLRFRAELSRLIIPFQIYKSKAIYEVL